MKKILSNPVFRYGVFVVTGIIIGWILFHETERKTVNTNLQSDSSLVTIWTCAMHPQVRREGPGKCPICGMELIPLNQDNARVDKDAIKMTEEAAQLANVQTTLVKYEKPVKEIRLYGKVSADERNLQSQVSHLPGRIEKLMVNFTGERVVKGQKLAIIYSPQMVIAQQELLEAAQTKSTQPEIFEAAKDKLRQWKLTESQLSAIENSGTITNNFEVLSNATGIVTGRRVNNGDYVNPGTVLFEVADLSRLWVMFDAYETDLAFIQNGGIISFSFQALPGEIYTENISFIDPVIDPLTRVTQVRVEIKNNDGRLKPEMFATGVIQATIKEHSDKLVVPRTSVLWTGKRSIVYVKLQDQAEPVFKMREVTLGPELDMYYIILEGLEAGEEIVTEGAFAVDAAAQLAGKPSMMNHAKTDNLSEHNSISHSGKKLKSTEKKAALTNPAELDNFIENLKTIYHVYLQIKDALVVSDLQQANQSALILINALKEADRIGLKNEDQKIWAESSKKMNISATQMLLSSAIEEQRKQLSGLTSGLSKSIRYFGISGEKVYYMFCPMASDNNGDYWLSNEEKIRNPYFGEKMLTCGSVSEVFTK